MTPKEQGREIFFKMYETGIDQYDAKQCALIAVNYIITSNPHSNPFNTSVTSTMDYFQEVKEEIEKL
jgi:hypothetical protein